MPCLPPWSASARTEKEEVIKISLVENVFEGSHTGGKESVDYSGDLFRARVPDSQ